MFPHLPIRHRTPKFFLLNFDTEQTIPPSPEKPDSNTAYIYFDIKHPQPF